MNLKYLFLFSFLLVSLIGCKSKDEKISENNLEQYQDYVTNVSQGVISVKSDVRVLLFSSVTSWNKGDELDSNLFTVSPNVKGKVVALDDRTIGFIPTNDFEQDTKYTFTLNLKDIITDFPDDLEPLTFSIKTFKQQFNVYINALESHSVDMQYLNGQIRSADVLTIENLKKMVTARYKDQTVNIKFRDGIKQGTNFDFTIDSIQRYENDTMLLISWDGSTFDIESNGDEKIIIPGKSSFVVLEASVEINQNTDSRLISINFSDLLKKGQNFKGLVTLQGDNNPKYSIKGNILKIYPSKDLEGDAKLEIFEGIQNKLGYKLKKKFTKLLIFEELKPQAKFISNGTILPSSNNLKINFETVNLKAIDVSVIRIYQNNILQFLQDNNLSGSRRLKNVGKKIITKKISLEDKVSNINKWTAHAINLSTLITPELDAIYRVELQYKPSYSSYPCDSEKEDDSNWNPDSYRGYHWNERDNPCSNSYYYEKKIGTNVLATDIGIIVKKGLNKNYFVAINNIIDTKPISNAKVTFYNFQQQPIGDINTDDEGKGIFNAAEVASFAIATYNGQKNYIKLNDGNSLSVSKFDVSGMKLVKGLKGFIFAERGVWRPGDKIFLSFILNDKANPLPKNHPVQLSLYDPYNKMVYNNIKTNGIDNFYNFEIKTDENASTGNWLAKIIVGGVWFTKTIKIETIKPNRLKIKTQFGSKILSGALPIKGNISIQWLHGAIAKNVKVDISAKFKATTTKFKGFSGYVFDDPSHQPLTEEQTVFKGKVNEQGKASFTLDNKLGKGAPGMLKAIFMTKAYENGGDFSTDVFTKPYSPFKTYVGLRSPKVDKKRPILLTDKKYKFEVVTVNENGKPKSDKILKVSIYKVKWRWWWDTSEDNLSEYSSNQYREKLYSKTIKTDSKGKANFGFEIKYPEWGRYLIRVQDPNGGHATGQTVSIDWPEWGRASRTKDPSIATMLSISTDKEKYNTGENAIISFPSSKGGRALVTVENGSEILKSLWVETAEEESKFELPITEEYTPNIYINITSLQPHASTKNDAPIRMYGITKINVENEETRLVPEISMPEVLRPEETITVEVSEKNNKSMTYSIAIVDEGLLDLTRFKTPNPWNTFYAREALGVKTWDIYDDVIGAFGGRINQVFAIGGDDNLAGAKKKKANRFKPMVVHLGPFRLEAGDSKSHQIKIPKYVGSVRTMIVAQNNEKEAYGIAEKTTPVRKPLMIIASIPRKISPGEKVVLPVTVFAMDKKIKNVKLRLKENKAFTIEGNSTQNISFSQPDEKMVFFKLNIAEFDGIGNIYVEASGNGETASFDIPIDVTNPNPISSEISQLLLDANAKQSIDLQTFGIKGSNHLQIEFSTLPAMNFNGRMKYLIQYPHGCVEQTTSSAFPQLYLGDIFDLNQKYQKQTQKNIDATVKRLREFQLANGSLSYWRGETRTSDWGTNYAGHFLIEAEKKGYVLPIGFKANWMKYQRYKAKQWRSKSEYSDLNQAYRLYVLALSENPDVASMNRLRETKNLSNNAKYRLSASYALIGQIDVAKQILRTAKFSFRNQHGYYTYGSIDRNRAMTLETYVLLKDKVKAQELAKTIAKKLSEKKWMSTQTTSYCLLAMAKFAEMVGGKGIKVDFSVNGKTGNISTTKTLSNREFVVKKRDNHITLKNLENSTVYVNIVNQGILPVGEEKVIQKNLVTKIAYKNKDGSSLDPTKITQGTNFVAEVTLKNTVHDKLKNIALTQIFPSGWEIVNTRFTDFGNFDENKVTHTDLRDDRANFYFDMKKNETKTFRILLNASYMGRYYLPGVQAEAMYDNNYSVRSKGQWVKVVR